MSGSPVTAYRVQLEFSATFGRRSLDSAEFPLFAAPGELMEVWELRCSELGEIVGEIETELKTARDHLLGLGCVQGASPSGDHTPTFYIVTDGGDEPELFLGELSAELGALDRPLEFTLVAVPVEPEEACAAVRKLRRGAWCEPKTTVASPGESETNDAWLRRVAVPQSAIKAAGDHLERLGGRIDLYSKLFAGLIDEPVDWLVQGLIPFSAVTLLVGVGAAGKSTAAQELLAGVTARSGPKTFWGQPINGCHVGALACGEDTAGIVSIRRQAHAKVWPEHGFMTFFEEGAVALDAALRTLESVPGRGLLVVDTLGAFATGDHTKDHVANDFYQPLTSFARRKEWAVVVLHHLVKNPPQSLSQILPSVKGSTSHVDRPRMVLAMLNRQGGTVEVGCIKTNFPGGAWQPVNKGVFLRRDGDTFRLLPIDGIVPSQPCADDSAKERVLSAVTDCNERETPVRRTGGIGLFKQGLPQLAGMSRQQIEAAAGSLVEAGVLVNTENGLVAVNKA